MILANQTRRQSQELPGAGGENHGWTARGDRPGLDLRRRADAERGVMDFLFVRAAEHYKGQGFEGLNLGLSPLAGVGEEDDAGLTERVVRLLY